MTNPMTPTEQDKELKSYIVEQLHSFDREEEMFDTYVNRFLQLITADRKRVALEARIDELERAKSLYQRTYKQEVTDNVGNIYVNDSHGYISSYEVQERIAELKAQQEDE